MAIIVEDGSLVTGANSYVDDTDLGLYAIDRGITISGDSEELLIKAMDYLESLNFIGTKYTKEQPLQWPRDGAIIDGYIINADEIPKELKKAQMEIALSIDAGIDPQANIERAKSRVKVGDLEVEYEQGQSKTTIVRKISNALSKLLSGGGSGSNFPVSRG